MNHKKNVSLINLNNNLKKYNTIAILKYCIKQVKLYF